MSSFDPSIFEQRRRGLLRNYSADSAMNSYQRFLSQRRGERNIFDAQRGFEQQTPRVVSSFSRRGLVGPNVRSGVFSKAMQQWDADRVRQLSRMREDAQSEGWEYDRRGRDLASQYEDALLDLDLEKYRQIQEDAMRLLQMRAGY